MIREADFNKVILLMHTSCSPRSRRWTSRSLCSGAVGGGGAPWWGLVSFSLHMVFTLTSSSAAAARIVGAGGQQRRVEEHAVEQVHELRREQLCAAGKREVRERPTARVGVVAAGRATVARVLFVLLQNCGDRCRQ